MEANNKEELTIIKSKIVKARKWAKKHFNAEGARDSKLVELVGESLELKLAKPAFYVSFPDVDMMTVQPSMFGIPSVFGISYKLCFDEERLYWQPLNTNRLPKLYVE